MQLFLNAEIAAVWSAPKQSSVKLREKFFLHLLMPHLMLVFIHNR